LIDVLLAFSLRADDGEAEFALLRLRANDGGSRVDAGGERAGETEEVATGESRSGGHIGGGKNPVRAGKLAACPDVQASPVGGRLDVAAQFLDIRAAFLRIEDALFDAPRALALLPAHLLTLG